MPHDPLVPADTGVEDVRPRHLAPADCVRLLARIDVGRLGYVDDDGPVVLPVNYRLYRGDVVFRVEEGGQVERHVCGRPVAFEVDEIDRATRSGWSVLVRGTAKAFPDGALLERRGVLDLRPWAPGRRSRFVRLRAAALTGRRIAPDLPGALWLG